MSDVVFLFVKDKNSVNIIESLAREIWTEHYIPIVGKEKVKYVLEKFQSAKAVSAQIKEGAKYFLIKQEESSIGYFSYVLTENSLFLSKIYILVSYRGMGIGKKVFEFLEKTAKENKLSEITLIVNRNNKNSIAVYEKNGFVISGSIINDLGNGFFMDDYEMRKSIP